MSRTVDEEGCPVYNDALIEEKKMTKEEMKAVNLCFGDIIDCESIKDCEPCPYYTHVNCDKALAADMAWLLKERFKTENSPSDARKGEGWSTISVDKNVGSNRELARPSLTINLVLKDDSSVPIVKEALSNFDDRRIDELTNYIKALIMLTKE